jgi:TP901 family phage tail tape measure protein
VADRTETVRLIANVSNYVSGMEAARVKTLAMANDSQAKLALMSGSLTATGTAFLGFGALVTAGVAIAIKEFADFDAKMAQVQTLAHATSAEMAQLRDAATSLGQGIGFSASEVADAEIELVKAGVSVKDILGGALQGSLQLAAAGQIKVADATEIATIALTQFKLQGSDIPHVADLLTAGADKALGGVQDLGEALKSGGLVASQFGVSLEETVGTLSAFANAGLIGETAGTDLRQVLLQLAAPSKQASDLMQQYGINVYDASGKFVGLAGLAGQLRDRLGGLTDAQRNSAEAIIFGTRAINGANVLYEEGQKGIQKWTSAVDDSGFAAQQAAGKMNNLKGDWSKLNAAIQSDFIDSASGANDVLRELTQLATGAAKGIGDIPTPALEAGLAIAGVVGAVALAGGTALIAVPKVAAFKASLDTIGVSGRSVGFAVGGVSAALSIGAIALGAWASAQAAAQAHVDDFEQSLDAATGKITKNTREIAKSALAAGNSWGWIVSQSTDSPYQAAKRLGISLDTLTDAALGNRDAMKKVDEVAVTSRTPDYYDKLAKMAKAAGLSERDYAAEANTVASAVFDQSSALSKAKQAQQEKKEADDAATKSSGNNTEALNALAGQAASTGDAVDSLADKIKGFGSAELDTRSASRGFQDSIDKLTASVQQNGRSLDEHTEQGRNNESALDDIAQSSLAYASALYKQTGDQDAATQAISDGRQALIDALGQFGITGQAAQSYADSLGLIPGNVLTLLNVDSTGGQKGIDQLLDKIAIAKNALNTLDIQVSAQPNKTVRRAGGGDLDAAPGPVGQDSMMFLGAKGEHVLTAREVAYLGGQGSVYALRRAIVANRGLPRAADGGGFGVSATYMSAPAAAPTLSLDGVRIQGTLDLGGGLTGFVDGRIAAGAKAVKTGISTGRQRGTL